jgi:hypothetical protein
MKRLVVISAALAALTLSTAAHAQEGETPEKLAMSRQVFQLANLPQMMDGITNMMTGMTKNVASQTSDAKAAAAAKRLEDFQRASLVEMKENFMPKLVDQMAHVYARNFTDAQLRDLLAFYQGPTGQALLSKTPAMMQQLLPMVMADLPDFLRGAMNRYCATDTCTAEEKAAFDHRIAALSATKP